MSARRAKKPPKKGLNVAYERNWRDRLLVSLLVGWGAWGVAACFVVLCAIFGAEMAVLATTVTMVPVLVWLYWSGSKR